MKPKIKRHVGGLAPDKYLSDEQIKTLIQYLRDHAKTKRGLVNLFIVQFLLFTGLRAEELLNLKFRDTSRFHCKDVVLVSRGKGAISRTILTPSILQVVVDCYYEDCRKGAKPGSYVIAAEGKNKMGYDSLLHRLKRIGIESGIGRLAPHALRHCYAVQLYAVQEDIRFVQKQLGHSNIESTAIYAQTCPKSGRKQVESLPIFGHETLKRPENTGKTDALKMLGL